MTSDSRPSDSPPLSAIALFSSRDRRSVALSPAAALGPAAPCGGVVVMASLMFPRTLASCPASLELSLCRSAASLARAGERPVYGVVLPMQATTTHAVGRGRRFTPRPVAVVRSLWRQNRHMPE